MVIVMLLKYGTIFQLRKVYKFYRSIRFEVFFRLSINNVPYESYIEVYVCSK